MKKDFLAEIVEHKKCLLKRKKAFFSSLEAKVADHQHTQYGVFKKAINQPGTLSLIAEIKKASPSRGLIRPQFDVMSLAQRYVDSGASAISVLTEERFFLGKPPYISRISENFTIPVLAKDFFIDKGQIYEAFVCGASAILLIVAILDDQKLKELIAVASQLDLDCLVEVHNEEELARAVDVGAEIIGVNNRDLKTFEVDLAASERLIPTLPNGTVSVVESGIRSNEDIKRIVSWGTSAVLIGETFLRASDVGKKVKEVMGYTS